MAIELRWLRSFVAVAEEMHFSRAARKLNLAQPALTSQIRLLEEALGLKLFERSNRMGGLTPAARALLPEARSILERTGALTRLAKHALRGEVGHLRVGIIPPAATAHLAERLRTFAADHPGLELNIRQGDQYRLMDRLVAGDLDLLIGRPPDPTSSGGALRSRKLFAENQGVILRADDPLTAYERIPVRQLDGLRLVLLRENPHFGQTLMAHAAKYGARLTPVHAAEDFPSLHWMVRAGLGLAPCSLLLADGLPRGLVARPLRPSPAALAICGLWRGVHPDPLSALLLQAIAAPGA